MAMTKLKNGSLINQAQVAAVFKRGPNWELLFASGHALVIDEEGAQELGAGADDEPEKGSKS